MILVTKIIHYTISIFHPAVTLENIADICYCVGYIDVPGISINIRAAVFNISFIAQSECISAIILKRQSKDHIACRTGNALKLQSYTISHIFNIKSSRFICKIARNRMFCRCKHIGCEIGLSIILDINLFRGYAI